MKKQLFVSSLAFLTLSFSACKKDDKDDNEGGSNPTTNQRPVVTFTGPISPVVANNTTIGGADVIISVNANDLDGNITKVEFYIGTAKISEDLSSPFQSTQFNVEVGTSTLYAVAFDNSGESTRVSFELEVTDLQP